MQLYNGDCLEIMKNIADKSVDCIITDPPYGIDYQSMWVKDLKKRKDKILNDKEPFISFIEHIPRILKNNGCCFIFTRWDVQDVFVKELKKYKMSIKNILIWDKGNHGMGDLKRSFGSRYESIIFCANNGFRFQNKRPVDIISCKKVPPIKLIHPNEKPVELIEYLVNNCCAEQGFILDPFMGSGTTGVACINTNRNFIGIELDETYFNIAKERIEKAHETKELF